MKKVLLLLAVVLVSCSDYIEPAIPNYEVGRVVRFMQKSEGSKWFEIKPRTLVELTSVYYDENNINVRVGTERDYSFEVIEGTTIHPITIHYKGNDYQATYGHSRNEQGITYYYYQFYMDFDSYYIEFFVIK